MKKIESVFGVLLWLVMTAFILLLPTLPLTVNKSIETELLSSLKQPKAVIFFGFQHCNEVCPLTLSTLARGVEKVADGKQLVQVIFVDIDQNSTQASANEFAQQFHPDFIGLHPSQSQLRQLSSQFGLNISQQDEFIRHQGRTYVLSQRGPSHWELTHTFNPNNLTVSHLVKLIEGV